MNDFETCSLAGWIAMSRAKFFFPLENYFCVVRFLSMEGFSKTARDIRSVVHESRGHGYGNRAKIWQILE